jgi:phage terminase Nu1 subunit (DNA packaging protein)
MAVRRQELCAELQISESTVRRMELEGLPFLLVGKRGKRYDLDEVKAWMREQRRECQSGPIKTVVSMSALWSMASACTKSAQQVRRRVMPSKSG